MHQLDARPVSSLWFSISFVVLSIVAVWFLTYVIGQDNDGVNQTYTVYALLAVALGSVCSLLGFWPNLHFLPEAGLIRFFGVAITNLGAVAALGTLYAAAGTTRQETLGKAFAWTVIFVVAFVLIVFLRLRLATKRVRRPGSVSELAMTRWPTALYHDGIFGGYRYVARYEIPASSQVKKGSIVEFDVVGFAEPEAGSFSGEALVMNTSSGLVHPCTQLVFGAESPLPSGATFIGLAANPHH